MRDGSVRQGETRSGSASGLPEGVRARVWAAARHFFSRHFDRPNRWLWLLRDDGRVFAARIELVDESCTLGDRHIADLLAHFDGEPGTAAWRNPALGTAWPLHAAPVVPLPRWSVSWGHPLQQAIRQFAALLDDEVLVALGRLEQPGPFLGSVANYNRIASLDLATRRHRLQALERFPPLVLPMLLEKHSCPDMFGEQQSGRRSWVRGTLLEPDAPYEAMDRGRDLIGALARHYQVGRALVRSPALASPWRTADAPRHMLQLLEAIPAHARPRCGLEMETRFEVLSELPVRVRTAEDVARLATAFAGGWQATWQRLETRFDPLVNALRDCRDFLQAALEQSELPKPLTWMDESSLGMAWVARRGIESLLAASGRWHAQPLVKTAGADDLPDAVAPVFGTLEQDGASAIELCTRQTLIDEGETMHHCVGGYWQACLCDPMRLVHLQLQDGSMATAQYACVRLKPDPRFKLVELRGPCNQSCDQAMHAFAMHVEAVFNSDRCSAQRDKVVAELHRACKLAGSPAAGSVRWLDRRSRDEMRQVLDHALQQPDWCVRRDAIYRGCIAGFMHAEGPRLMHRIDIGAPLRLVREEDNEHDPRAVRIEWDGHKLGYVARRENGPIARQLDAGVALRGEIVDMHSTDRRHWVDVEFVVHVAHEAVDDTDMAAA